MKLVHQNLLGITYSTLIYRLGSTLVGIFLPLILLNQGLTLWQVSGFYVFYSIFKLGIDYPIFRLINKSGAKLGLALGMIAGAAQLGLISSYLATSRIAFWLWRQA